MGVKLMFEETVPEHFIVYKPLSPEWHGSKYLAVRPLATVEKRCGKWLWWMRNESDIGLCSTFAEAKLAVTSRFDQLPDGFVPPSPADCREVADRFCRSRRVDPSVFDEDEFCRYYEDKGWAVRGGTVMKDWKAAVRAWIRRAANL